MRPIKVPLVQDDLDHCETILQIANTLDILKYSIENVFDHVNKSVCRTKQSLKSIQDRHKVVCDQIIQLKNINKSVTVYSSCKYPQQGSPNYQIDFQAKSAPKFKKNISVENDKKLDNVDIENKLKFYHVKTHDMLRKNMEVACDETLGKLPANIDSITSCMLFNTSQNVYEKYVIIDPLSSNKNLIRVDEEKIKQIKMEEAPKSLNQDDLLQNKQAFSFTPSMENVPFIELPLNLPDLTGFADDFQYSEDHVSRRSTDKNANLEEKDLFVNRSLTSTIENEITQNHTKQTFQSTSIVTEQPVSFAPTTFSKAETVTQTVPPPPPPLPFPSPPIPEAPSKVEPLERAPTSDSLHANLMEAIRNAGGSGKAKLKTVDSISKVDVTSSVGVASNVGGDLMSDLHAKLLMRRKGISGQVKESSSLMDKLLINIPPPPKPGAESESSEDDNENDTEWDD